ncbi:MAG: LysM peptidoglycan-binding domain-containing protein [Planctomycetia bacterium]|jgi:hypothetical protein
MGKEAKIGLSIIGILIIIFAIVLGQKLLGPKDDSEVAKNKKPTVSQKDGKKKKPPRRTKPSPKPKDQKNTAGKKKPPTPALSVSQNYPGGSSTASDATNWAQRYSKSPATNSPLPNTQGSTQLQAQTGNSASGLQSAYPSYSGNTYSNAYTNPHYAAQYPTQNPSSSGSDYKSQYSYNQNTTTPDYGTHGQNDGQQNQRYQYGQEDYNTGRTASSDYGTHSAHGDRSHYRSASFDRSRHEYNKDDYGHRYSSDNYNYDYKPSSSYSSGSDYGGGPQADGTYIVKPHQTYYSISKEVYGIEAYFKALAEVNRSSIPDENRLKVGDRIKTPDRTELERTYPDLCPSPKRVAAMERRSKIVNNGPRYGGSGRQYIVQSGDTLYDIARYELGDAARWTDIYKLNRQLLGDSFDYLTPGLKLDMPSKDAKTAAAETIYDPSSSRYDNTRGYDDTSSRYKDYRSERPRTATRPGGYHRPSSSSPSSGSYPSSSSPSSNYPYGNSGATSRGY